MRAKSKSRCSPRASKRKQETASSSVSEPKSRRISKKNGSEEKVDKYCWLCHTEANDKICFTCRRAYHNKCLDKTTASLSELRNCPECNSESVDGTKLSPSKFFTSEKLKKILDVLTRRSFAKKREKNEIFLRWPEEDRNNLYKIIDYEIMLDNINHVLPYGKTAELYGDVKFIYHNSCIAYGVHSDQAKAAENLRRDFKAELLDLEACPECYYYLYCDENGPQDSFVRLCDSPHDIVWAQLTGHPYWPAKCLKVVKGFAHVRFFGEHEQSNIPISKCLFLSESHPKDKNSKLSSATNSGPKSQRYKSAKTELMNYIQLYSRKYGHFPFYPHKTPYKPAEKEDEEATSSTEGISNRNSIQMKLERNINEETIMHVIDAARIVDSEDNLPFPDSVTSDIPTPNGSGTEGQYPTLAQLNPSIHPDSSPGGGQYPTLAQLQSNVFPSSVVPSPGQDNLNKNQSVVTSINMTFSQEENNFNVEIPDPVVTSIGPLQPADTSSNILSTSSESLLDHLPAFKKLKNISHCPPDQRMETVNNAQMFPEIVENNVTSDSCNIVNNLPLHAGTQTEVDNEVCYLGQSMNLTGNETFNPDIVLPVLMSQHPDLEELVSKARYLTDGVMLQLWASLFNNSNNIGKISKLCVDLRKCRTELKKALQENQELKKEKEATKYVIQEHNSTVEKLETDKQELLAKIQMEKERNAEAVNNARSIIRSLKSGCSKKIEEMLKSQYMNTIREKEDIISRKNEELQSLKGKIENLEEENNRMKEEAAKAKDEIQRTTKALQDSKYTISPDLVSEYKRTHYCCVCDQFAAIVCCINTSYCSLECQARHAKKHLKECKKGQSFVQQRVSQQTVVFMQKHDVITSEKSALNNSSNFEISETDSHHKKAHIHHVSASPLLPTPHDRGMASSSRSYSSKNKRRTYKQDSYH